MVFKKHSFFFTAFFSCIVILPLLIIAEISLRKNGEQPGVINTFESFEIVDSLFVHPDFAADEHGITKINPAIIHVLNKFVRYPGNDSLLYLNPEFNRIKFLTNVTLDFKKFHEDASGENEFEKFINYLNKREPDNLDTVDSAYLNYSVNPINSDGFRSIEFKNYLTSKKKILLLGDSFAWGMSAAPITNSFADILSAKGFAVFNTGIAAVDPPQYLAIAQVYIPVLKPDVVVVNFFMGNDEMDYLRLAEPWHPAYHYTNAGLLSAYPERVYLTPQQAYQFIMSKISIPEQGKFYNRMMSKTVLTTRLWLLVSNLSKKYFPPPVMGEMTPPETHVSEFYIDGIKKICDDNGAEMILALIPFNEKNSWQNSMYENFKIQAEKNFKHTTYHYPDNLEPEDFGANDDHFSNTGMKKYADFLQGLIDSVLSGKE